MKNEWLYVRVYLSEEARRHALVPFLNEYNHQRTHTSLGNKPPISRAPQPGPLLTQKPIVVPTADPGGQLVINLFGDDNVPREHT